MKNKKGFSLTEIIVSIAIIVVIGTVSIIGINYISKNIRINKLNDIEDEIMTAAKIYLELNKEVNQRVYNSNEGVIVPLKSLVEEGLLDLSTTELDMKDINGEYIVAALASSSPTEPCVDLKALTSWEEDSSQKIYLCSKSDGSVSIQGSGLSANNYSAVTREPIDFSNEYRYVIFNGIKYRLLRLDSDDSLTILNWGSFGDTFKGKVLPMITTLTSNISFDIKSNTCGMDRNKVDSSSEMSVLLELSDAKTYQGIPINITTNILGISFAPILANGICYKDADYKVSLVFGMETKTFSQTLVTYKNCNGGGLGSRCDRTIDSTAEVLNQIFKIRLKPCMKIVGGTGDFATPYELKDTCG